MAKAHRQPSGQVPDADSLLEVVDSFPALTTIGFEPTGGGMSLHIKDLVPDERSAAGDLFGFRAPDSWHAVGMKLAGRAVDLNDPSSSAEPPDPQVPRRGDKMSSAMLLVRTGEFAWRTSFGEAAGHQYGSSASGSTDAPQGVTIDTLHRVMGLPSPGTAPPPALLALSLWLDAVMTEVAADNSITWSRAASLQLATTGPTPLDRSVEAVAGSIVADGAAASWDRLRLKAAKMKRTSSNLSPREMRWMDATMFARWIMSFLPDVDLVVSALAAAGCEEVARRATQVIDAVVEVSSRPEEWPFQAHIA